jgi:hypothetical protein
MLLAIILERAEIRGPQPTSRFATEKDDRLSSLMCSIGKIVRFCATSLFTHLAAATTSATLSLSFGEFNQSKIRLFMLSAQG